MKDKLDYKTLDAPSPRIFNHRVHFVVRHQHVALRSGRYQVVAVIRPRDVPPGYKVYQHFGEFWRATEFWILEPSDGLVDSGWCLANPGREYVVFQNAAGPFTLEIAGAQRPLKAEWFNQLTGARTSAGELKDGTARLTPPANWGDAPLVLHAKAKL